MRKFERLEGLIAAPFTPMTADGGLRTEAIGDYARLLAEGGVKGVFICGTTGESLALTLEERMEVAESWVAAAQGRLRVIVHIGSNCAADAIRLARHAEACGADAVGAMAPCFFKPQSAEELVAFFTPVANSTALPFYYYNMPSMTGVSVPVARFLELGSRVMPTLAGVKFTHNNLMEMAECIALDGGRFEVLHGYDEILLCGLALGAVAAVGSTYNYVPELYNRLIAAFRAGRMEEAAQLQQESVGIVRVLIRYGGGVRAGKAIMRLAGVDCGPCRLPLAPFTEEEYRLLEEDLRQIGFFEKWRRG